MSVCPFDCATCKTLKVDRKQHSKHESKICCLGASEKKGQIEVQLLSSKESKTVQIPSTPLPVVDP